MRTYRFSVLIRVEPDGEQFYAYCPALKGLHTCGETREEATQNAINAATAYLESLIKHGDPIPVGVLPQKAKKISRKGTLGSSRAKQYITELAVIAT